jgi:hypothetical protein
VRLLFGFFFCFAIAAFVGLGGTWFSLTRGMAFGALQIGAWTAWPKNGTIDADPYSRAVIARTGSLPIGSGDGIAFFARTDDAGNAFDGRCEFVLKGITPVARYWTLTLYEPNGQLVPNLANRFGFTSQDIVRDANGGFEIVMAPRARAGNWLPTGGTERYILVLRLYDTPVGVATRAGREAPMPSITKRVCP